MTILVRLPQRAADFDACSGCNRTAVAIIEFGGPPGMTSIQRVCEPCGHALSTQLQEMNL